MAIDLRMFSRRAVLGSLAACAASPALATNSAAAGNMPDDAPLPSPATPNGKPWTEKAFAAAMAASGRPLTLREADFAAIQSARPKTLQVIRSYLTRQLGLADPHVMAAFAAVPREYFTYNYEQRLASPLAAYAAPDKPFPLGYGAELPDCEIQAVMTQLLSPRPGETALEIGTGSGFHTAMLSRIAAHVSSIEIIPPLAGAVRNIFAPLGYGNITTRTGDGYNGWPDHGGGFDLILVTCAVPYIPPPLIRQLKPGGRLLAPLYRRAARRQALYLYHKDATGTLHNRREMRCFFEPMTGLIATQPAPPGADL